jgi:trans-aconitate methyltransferase
MSSPADAIIDLYRRHARAWTSARGTRLTEQNWLDKFIALLPPRATVLDIGCGSGEPIARYITTHGHPVAAVDSAPEMLALFQQNFPGATTHLADMRSLQLGQRFAGLIAWDSFFHLSQPHQRLMFPIFRAHAEPQAPLLFTSGPQNGEAIGTLEGEPLYHASLDTAEYRRLLDENGFDLIAHIAEDPACTGHSVWLARRRPT